MGLVELAERGELDHRLHLVLEQSGRMLTLAGVGMAEARADADEVGRHVLEQDRPAVGRGLADQAFAQLELAASAASRLSAP